MAGPFIFSKTRRLPLRRQLRHSLHYPSPPRVSLIRANEEYIGKWRGGGGGCWGKYKEKYKEKYEEKYREKYEEKCKEKYKDRKGIMGISVVELAVLLAGGTVIATFLTFPTLVHIPKELENARCNLLPTQAGDFYHLHLNFLRTCLHKLFIWVFRAEHSLKRCSLVCLLLDTHH